MTSRPLVIGHRGACGYVPEHTLTSYFIAMQAGVDFVEPDLVMSRDGVLIARHENEISATTDVAAHPQFAARRTTRIIDGVSHTGWFTEDFTLAELKTLRARERIPQIRPANVRFDGQFEIPTLDEILELLRAVQEQRTAAAQAAGRTPPVRIGVYPETKHPSYFAARNLAMERTLVDTLHRHGYQGPDGAAFIQCFEVGNLKAMRGMTELPIVQLMEDEGAPYDLQACGDPRTYRDMCTPTGLAEIATYANAIGPHKLQVIALTADQAALAEPTRLVRDAHAAGLKVHAYTFRAENRFLPGSLRAPDTEFGDLQAELHAYLSAGLDGFFTDHPDIGVRARDAAL
ncbi:MAG: glycerophosphodiester phosphodiesterase [Sinobacteraceae bacterium]|nr:glycerophosphodiester phosphodiesterase [Nevskiaceae bacterium]